MCSATYKCSIFLTPEAKYNSISASGFFPLGKWTLKRLCKKKKCRQNRHIRKQQSIAPDMMLIINPKTNTKLRSENEPKLFAFPHQKERKTFVSRSLIHIYWCKKTFPLRQSQSMICCRNWNETQSAFYAPTKAEIDLCFRKHCCEVETMILFRGTLKFMPCFSRAFLFCG